MNVTGQDVHATIEHAEAIIFDIDGSVVLGEAARSGARELISTLRKRNKRLLFLSNDSNTSTAGLCRRLNRIGLDACLEDILTPVTLAGRYIAEGYGACGVSVLGSEALRASVVKAGHTICDASGCDVVLVGRDQQFSFRRLEAATASIQRGSGFVATNLDLSHPVDNGMLSPQTGSLVASIAAVCGTVPDLIGKPSSYLFSYAKKRLAVAAERTVMIGDNPTTDILGGNRQGFVTILLRGAMTRSPSPFVRRLEQLFQDSPPDEMLPDFEVDELPTLK